MNRWSINGWKKVRTLPLSVLRQYSLWFHTKNLKKIYTTSLMTQLFVHVIVCTGKNRTGIVGSER